MTTLTELEKLIAGATDPAGWKADPSIINPPEFFVRPLITPKGLSKPIARVHGEPNAAFIATSRQALPNALRVIAECKRSLEGVKTRLFNENNSAQGRLMAAYEVATKALALIAEFEQNVEGM